MISIIANDQLQALPVSWEQASTDTIVIAIFHAHATTVAAFDAVLLERLAEHFTAIQHPASGRCPAQAAPSGTTTTCTESILVLLFCTSGALCVTMGCSQLGEPPFGYHLMVSELHME
jgi:hypothetical protein